MTALESLTDGELLEAVRAGNKHAYGVLFSRHQEAALRVARRQTPDRHLAEDAVNEAFAAVLAAIQGGSGPVGVFGPYLFSSVSRAVYRMNHRSMRETPVVDADLPDVAMPETHPVLEEFDGAAAREAFKALPARWREVLWYLEIEEMQPRDASPLLGLSPNATVALHRRAKDGLRLGYLQQHVAVNGPDECREMAAHIPAHVLGTLRQSKKAALEQHLESCEKCGAVLLQIRDLGSLRAAILPVLAILPLSEFYPSGESGMYAANGQQPADPGAMWSGTKDALHMGFVAVMVISGLALGFASFGATAEQDQASQGAQEKPTPDPAPSPQVPSNQVTPAAWFDVLSHSGNQAVASVTVRFPDASATKGRVAVDPGIGARIKQVTSDPADGWTCTITQNGAAECQTPAVQSSALALMMEMGRPACPSKPISLVVSINDIESLRQTWDGPCASN